MCQRLFKFKRVLLKVVFSVIKLRLFKLKRILLKVVFSDIKLRLFKFKKIFLKVVFSVLKLDLFRWFRYEEVENAQLNRFNKSKLHF